jgi:hypothetical protein
MPVENHFSGRATKKPCQHQKKGLTQIACSIDRNSSKNKKKNPQLLCAIGIVLFAAISTALKKWWQKRITL